MRNLENEVGTITYVIGKHYQEFNDLLAGTIDACGASNKSKSSIVGKQESYKEISDKMLKVIKEETTDWASKEKDMRHIVMLQNRHDYIDIIRYIYNIYLRGCGLGAVSA